MANLALRSPQYKTAVANTGTPLSTKLTITIDTVLRYTLVKSTSLNENMLWEISQLYAVKLSSIYKKNPLFTDREVRKGDIIYLKNKKN